MDVTFDAPDLERLMSDLVGAEGSILSGLRPVVKRSAQNIKTDAQARVRGFLHGAGHTHLPNLAASINYDEPTIVGSEIVSDIGYDRDATNQGGFGRGFEFGSSNTGPRPSLMPAVDDEEPKLEEAAVDVAVRVLS